MERKYWRSNEGITGVISILGSTLARRTLDRKLRSDSENRPTHYLQWVFNVHKVSPSAHRRLSMHNSGISERRQAFVNKENGNQLLSIKRASWGRSLKEVMVHRRILSGFANMQYIIDAQSREQCDHLSVGHPWPMILSASRREIVSDFTRYGLMGLRGWKAKWRLTGGRSCLKAWILAFRGSWITRPFSFSVYSALGSLVQTARVIAKSDKCRCCLKLLWRTR